VFGHVDKDDPVVLITSGFKLSDNDLRIRFIDFLLQKYPTQLYVINLNRGLNPKYDIPRWSHTFLNKDVFIDYVIESSCPMVIREKIVLGDEND
tara:strand:+ start:66 stop:347 length:282 start_codon:yes stop_codon:yes gene_type:complete